MILQYTIRGEFCQWGRYGKLVLFFKQMEKTVKFFNGRAFFQGADPLKTL